MEILQHVRQTQTFSLSQYEALQYLQLPLAELDSHLQKLVEANPLLELVLPTQTLPHQHSKPYNPRTFEYQDELTPENKQTFKQMLLDQLNQSAHIQPKLLPSCRYLIECLDHHGFLTDSLDELASETTFSLELLHDSLSQIKLLSPCGVGAQSLEECLSLQLCEREQLDDDMKCLLDHGLSALAHGNLAQLAKDCHLTRTKLTHLISRLQTLNPYPSQSYQTDASNTYIFPEATVTEENGIFTAEFHRNCVSNLTLNPEYVAMLHSTDADTVSFLKPLYSAAQAQIHNLDRRYSTVEQIILERKIKRYTSGSGMKESSITLSVLCG